LQKSSREIIRGAVEWNLMMVISVGELQIKKCTVTLAHNRAAAFSLLSLCTLRQIDIHFTE
jgi:hypothetical protein